MWNITKIQQYINDGIEESLNLDYKGAGALQKTEDKKKEISKDVSAFANSDGGVIIYGVREYDSKELAHLPEKIDPVDRSLISKEWLEQIINSRISPRIKDLKIIPIQVEDKEKNKVIYVVKIPKSNTVHQMADKRYYKRYNFQSIAMNDWEVKDVMNRSNVSDIEILFDRFNKAPIHKIKNYILKKVDFITFDVIAKNNGNKAVHMLDVFISCSKSTMKRIKGNKQNVFGSSELIYKNEIERKISFNNQDLIINTERIPILPKTLISLGEISFKSDIISLKTELEIQISTEDNCKTVSYLLGNIK